MNASKLPYVIISTNFVEWKMNLWVVESSFNTWRGILQLTLKYKLSATHLN